MTTDLAERRHRRHSHWKGERVMLHARVAPEVRDQALATAEATGQSVGELLSKLIAKAANDTLRGRNGEA
jgi:predicted HicB family RNase H-like nuclease